MKLTLLLSAICGGSITYLLIYYLGLPNGAIASIPAIILVGVFFGEIASEINF